MEENHSYTDVIGNPAMPYLNSLASTYSVAQGYYANTHPSIGNYFMLTTGQIITNDDGYTQTVTVDNVVRELIAAGKTWKEYSEALPLQGYDGGDTGEYAERHNPLSYMSDVRNNPAQMQNLVPFPQLATDIANHALPNYGFIVPDLFGRCSRRHAGNGRRLAANQHRAIARQSGLQHARRRAVDYYLRRIGGQRWRIWRRPRSMDRSWP
jgi:acid phosphatase